MPIVSRRLWTPEDVDRLVDERAGLTPRYELVAGELLVTPAPTDRHQRIVAELYVMLRQYVSTHRLGEARLGPARARISPTTRFEPDLFVVAAEHGKRPREVWRSNDERPLVVDGSLCWRPNVDVPAFEVDVRAFFAAVADG